MKTRWKNLLAAAMTLIAAGASASNADAPLKLKLVTESDYQWTGVAVSSAGRVFLSFPTISEFPSFHLAELKGGVPVSFLDRASEGVITNLTGIYIDSEDRLWALDAGMVPTSLGGAARNQPKVFCISIRDHRIRRAYPIPSALVSAKSRFADLRVDTRHNCAYVTDGGMARILTIDLDSGKAWVALDETVTELRASASFIAYPKVNYSPEALHVNGLTLSEDGTLLYFTPLISSHLYTIPTEALADPGLTVAQRRRLIRTGANDISPSAGMVAKGGKLYTGDIQNFRILSTDLATGRTTPLPLPVPVHWADDFAADARGGIWFTESERNIPVEQRRSYRLYRLAP